MPNPPRRARFQVHLSTAIVLMFAAGGLMWVNMRGYITSKYHSSDRDNLITAYGWPYKALYLSKVINKYHDRENYIEYFGYTEYWMGALDAVVAFVIVVFIWFACEWLIRRRALKKGA